MRQKGKVKRRDGGNETRRLCRHYWKIEIADGPRSMGVCQYCGEAREFLNYVPLSSVTSRWARIPGNKARVKGQN